MRGFGAILHRIDSGGGPRSGHTRVRGVDGLDSKVSFIEFISRRPDSSGTGIATVLVLYVPGKLSILRDRVELESCVGFSKVELNEELVRTLRDVVVNLGELV